MEGDTVPLNKVIRLGLTEETSEPRLKGSKGMSFDVIKEMCSQQRDSRCKSPGVGVCLVCWRNVQVARLEAKTIGIPSWLVILHP